MESHDNDGGQVLLPLLLTSLFPLRICVSCYFIWTPGMMYRGKLKLIIEADGFPDGVNYIDLELELA